MYYALALALCLAVLALVLAAALVLCSAALCMVQRMPPSVPPGIRANLFFILRALPFFLAGLVTLGFALPAFLRFEPRSSNEIMGPRLLVLAVLGGLVVTAIAIRTVRIIHATHSAQKRWRISSRRLQLAGVKVPVYCASRPSPLLAVTGLFRPRIFVSEAVVRKLSSNELLAAMAHELAHVNALDNWKQLILKATRLLPAVDAAWVDASEIAADEKALASGASALDLSSALVKAGELSRHTAAHARVSASHLLPPGAESSIATRVNHLSKLLERELPENILPATPEKRNSTWYWAVSSVFLLVLSYAVCVNAVLPWMHEILELLVR